MTKLILITLEVEGEGSDPRSPRTDEECWALFRETLKDACLGESVLQLQGFTPTAASVEELTSPEVLLA